MGLESRAINATIRQDQHRHEPMNQQEHAQQLIDAIDAAHFQFGIARIQLGVLLERVRETEAWKGRAESFTSFLEERRLTDSAAYQYMRVARKLFYELQLTDEQIAELATCNMSTLDLACKIITKDNAEEIVCLISALSRRDARAEIEAEISMRPAAEQARPRREPAIERMLRLYRELPDDQRIDFMNVLRPKNRTAYAQ